MGYIVFCNFIYSFVHKRYTSKNVKIYFIFEKAKKKNRFVCKLHYHRCQSDGDGTCNFHLITYVRKEGGQHSKKASLWSVESYFCKVSWVKNSICIVTKAGEKQLYNFAYFHNIQKHWFDVNDLIMYSCSMLT